MDAPPWSILTPRIHPHRPDVQGPEPEPRQRVPAGEGRRDRHALAPICPAAMAREPSCKTGTATGSTRPILHDTALQDIRAGPGAKRAEGGSRGLFSGSVTFGDQPGVDGCSGRGSGCLWQAVPLAAWRGSRCRARQYDTYPLSAIPCRRRRSACCRGSARRGCPHAGLIFTEPQPGWQTAAGLCRRRRRAACPPAGT